MTLDEAISFALDGDAILFCGAGFSLGASNVRGTQVKSGRQLAKHLAEAAGLPADTPLEDAAEEFAQQKGEDVLIDELRNEFSAKAVTEAHTLLANLPWRRIYTTNYDNVLEVSRAKRALTSVTLSDDPRDVSLQDALCVHLNGSIAKLNRSTVWSEIKLTDVSYATSAIVTSSWATLLRQDLALARAVIFVGYSLADLDVKRILFETQDLRDKTFFILGPAPDPATLRRAVRYGTALKIGTEALAHHVSDLGARYVARSPIERIGYCLKPFVRPTGSVGFTDAAVFDLLLRGEVRPELLWDSLHGDTIYFLERKLAQRSLKAFADGTRCIVFHSELGNGKTLLLEGVKFRALELGYSVYSTGPRTDDALREVSEILRMKRKTLLVIDNYPGWMDVIEYFGLHADPQSAIALSVRSSVHDLVIDRVIARFGRDKVREILIDQLLDAELEWVSAFFDRYGLWGDRASLPAILKLRFLREDCAAEFHAVLLRLFESPHILAKYNELLSGLDNKRPYYEVVIGILALAVLNVPTRTETLVDLWGDRVLEAGFRRDPIVQQLLDFDHGTAKFRSGAAAEFILRRVSNADLTVDTLAKVARTADRLGRLSSIYRGMLTSLMKFSNLQRLLPEQNRRLAVLRFYENIKDLFQARENPQFWLQYAIGCVVVEEFERADSYFKTAYAFARKLDAYDTFQIDNHFARFLLARVIKSRDASSAMSPFREARAIIGAQIAHERLHYPYRVAKSYKEFFDVFETQLSYADLEEVARAAQVVIERIGTLPEFRRSQKYVQQCHTAMESIMTRFSAKKPPAAPMVPKK